MTTFYFTQNNQIVSVRIQADEPINAWNGEVIIPTGMSLGNVISAGSITKIWQTTPRTEGNKIIFTGGTPNGFVGDGLLFQFVAGRGNYTLNFSPNTLAYLDDGAGTPTDSVLQSLDYFLAQKQIVEPRIDREPPQIFTPEIYNNKNFFDGHSVAVFSAIDYESGISHYEIREFTNNGIGNWTEAESPYLINPDIEKLEIKAVDAFGNERVAILDIGSSFWSVNLIFSITLLIIGLVIVYNLIRRKFSLRSEF